MLDSKHLEHIILDDNKIGEVPTNIGSILPHLKTLFLESNHLTSIPASLCTIKSIMHLEVSYNHISSYPKEVIQLGLKICTEGNPCKPEHILENREELARNVQLINAYENIGNQLSGRNALTKMIMAIRMWI